MIPAAALREEELLDRAGRRGDHLRALGRRNVGAVVRAQPAAARLAPGVADRRARHAGDGDGELRMVGRLLLRRRGGLRTGRRDAHRRREEGERRERRRADREVEPHAAHSRKTAGVPGFTIDARRATSQLARRMQPWLSERPIWLGSGVPWMP